MQALRNVKILELALAKAKANNPDWKPLLLNCPEDIIQMGHENIVLFNQGFAQAFWGEVPHTVIPTGSHPSATTSIESSRHVDEQL